MVDAAETAAVGAALAALGYVGKLLIESWLSWRRSVRRRKARLVELQSLLLASRRVFEVQAVIRNDLCNEYIAADSRLGGLPYDEVLARGFASANTDQKLRHGLIRQYTIAALRPLNKSMLEWINADTFYKLAGRGGMHDDLSLRLRTLEAHLLLWLAKFDFWIPDKPERALVYMADEQAHGAGFPPGIESIVEQIAGGTYRAK